MMYFTVPELASKLEVGDETVRRWLRDGKLPNSTVKSKIYGWQIPISDLPLISEFNPKMRGKVQKILEGCSENIQAVSGNIPVQSPEKETKFVIEEPLSKEEHLKARIKYVFNAVSLQRPSDELVKTLVGKGIEGTLEALLYCAQYERTTEKIKNWDGFLKRYCSDNWTMETISEKKCRSKLRSSNKPSRTEKAPQWLEEQYKEYKQTLQLEIVDGKDLEEERKKLEEELKQYKKK